MSSQWLRVIIVCTPVTILCSAFIVILARGVYDRSILSKPIRLVACIAVFILFLNIAALSITIRAEAVQASSTAATTELLHTLLTKVGEEDQEAILQHVIALNEASYRPDQSIAEDYMRFAQEFSPGHRFREDLLLHAGTHGVTKHPPAETANTASDSASP